MKRILILAAMMAATTAPALAQNAPEIATLTAEGTGVVNVVPDIVIVSIGVTSRAGKPAEALEQNNVDMQAVIDSVIAAGVSEADIATSSFSINPVYDDGRPDDLNEPIRIVAYVVTNQVTVRIRDFDASGPILNAVVAAGANQINGIRLEVADAETARDEALAAAIADAQARAELMAEAAGVELVRILTVNAYSNAQPMFEQAAFARSSVPIIGGEQGITANATLVFEIAPL